MPLGIVSQDEFEAEKVHLGIIKSNKVQNSEVVSNGEIFDLLKGRGNKKETPEVIRNIVSECALEGAPHKELMSLFGVSQASVSAYKKGATSTATYDKPDTNLKDHTNKVRARITNKANNRIMQALDGITKVKMEDCKPRDLAAIAKDMSAIIKNIDPPKDERDESNVKFVIYAPQLKQENDFQIIHVNE